MHPAITRSGRSCEKFDDYAEVCRTVGYDPPKYCNKCGVELGYISFFDSLERYTVKAGCPKCKDSWAVAISREKYEAKMLERWTHRVKDRDHNRCRMENAQCSGDLHAHHMIPKAADPSKMFDVENGITLCEFHHKKIHRFM